MFMISLNYKIKILVYSFKYAGMWWVWSLNKDFMFSQKSKILTKGKFWFTNFTKNCLKWYTKRQSWSTNQDLWIANSNPVLFFFSKDDTSNLVKKLSSEVQSTIKWNNPLILNACPCFSSNIYYLFSFWNDL